MVWLVLGLLGCSSDGLESDHDGSLRLPLDSADPSGSLIVDIDTSLGRLSVALDEDAAPITVENFLGYVDSGFFDGRDGGGATVFHRVIADFVAQGGGHTEDGSSKSPGPAITLESDNGLSNRRGTIAMARTAAADSATSQFYFNLIDNDFLDYQDAAAPGYAVFGALIDGLDVLDSIGAVDTDGSDWPEADVVIMACQRR